MGQETTKNERDREAIRTRAPPAPPPPPPPHRGTAIARTRALSTKPAAHRVGGGVVSWSTDQKGASHSGSGVTLPAAAAIPSTKLSVFRLSHGPSGLSVSHLAIEQHPSLASSRSQSPSRVRNNGSTGYNALLLSPAYHLSHHSQASSSVHHTPSRYLTGAPPPSPRSFPYRLQSSK